MFGVSAIRRAIDTLMSMHTWLLVGLTMFLSLIWFWPPRIVSWPEQFEPLIRIALLLTAILTGCKLADSGLVHFRDRRRLRIEREQKRLLNVYRPLNVLLLTCHVSVFESMGSPYLRDRLENAWARLTTHRRRTASLKRAWRALFDRQVSSSAEVEFGSDFPMFKIVKLVRSQSEHVDAELLRLVQLADRSRYEEPNHNLLTEDEVSLLYYIDAEHKRLSAGYDHPSAFSYRPAL